jgi:tetratricopeptide (TPR) repeat protein
MKYQCPKTILILAVVFLNNFSIGQDKLTELDSLAFAALESRSGKAEEFANHLLEKTKGNPNSLHTINAYTILGIVNKDKGYYVSALNFYLKALNAAQIKKDQERVSSALNNIGVIYQLQRNYQAAISYFSNSLKIEEKYNNPLQKSIRYYNIGDCYKELDSFELALSYFNNSLLIEQKYNNKEGITYAFLGIAEVYLGIGQIEDAKRILDKINLEVHYVEESIFHNKLLGTYHLKKDNFAQALVAFQAAQTISEKHNFPIHLVEIYKSQIDVLDKLHNKDLLVEKYRELTDLNDRLNAIEIQNKIHDLTFSNEIQKKEMEISLIAEERNFAEKLTRYNGKIALFLMVVLLLIASLVIYSLRKRKK